MDYSSAWLMRIRRVGQQLGILRPMQRLYRSLFQSGYEAAFEGALRRCIREGDTVWDVGANIGTYTREFSDWVGPDGQVVAIEPSPSSLPALHEAVAGCSNVRVEETALSNEPGEVRFFISTEGASANDGLSPVGSDTEMATHVVRSTRGEELARHMPPCVIKIDVEGFEKEVIEGLGNALNSSRLRAIAIEVHFQTLARRGLADAPRALVTMLEDGGFRVRWTDPSHLIAERVER